ncbi:MAG: SDR family NAD(P)-dependent oxidoreductase, partial [Acidimicrobiales bacterium]
VRDHAAVAATVENLPGKWKAIEVLVNNAGLSRGLAGLHDGLVSDWDEMIDTKVKGLLAVDRAVVPLMVARGRGIVIHIGSIAGRMAGGGFGPYAASKHAVSAFNWALRAELALDTKMKSSVIEPGEIKTEIWAKGRETVAELEGRLREAGMDDRYASLMDAQRPYLAEDSTRGVEADKVADAVQKALTARHPRARYLVGPDARGMGVVTRFPDRWRETLIRTNARQMARAGRKLR